jgi:hypothetical protein
VRSGRTLDDLSEDDEKKDTEGKGAKKKSDGKK